MVQKMVAGGGALLTLVGAGLMGAVATMQSFVTVEVPGIDACTTDPLGNIGIFKSSYAPGCTVGFNASETIGSLAAVEVDTTDFPLLFPSTTDFGGRFTPEGQEALKFESCATFYAEGGPADSIALNAVIGARVLPGFSASLTTTFAGTKAAIDFGIVGLRAGVNGFLKQTIADTAVNGTVSQSANLAKILDSIKNLAKGAAVATNIALSGGALTESASFIDLACSDTLSEIPVAGTWADYAGAGNTGATCKMGAVLAAYKGGLESGSNVFVFEAGVTAASLNVYVNVMNFLASVIQQEIAFLSSGVIAPLTGTLAGQVCAGSGVGTVDSAFGAPCGAALSSFLGGLVIIGEHPSSNFAGMVSGVRPFGLPQISDAEVTALTTNITSLLKLNLTEVNTVVVSVYTSLLIKQGGAAALGTTEGNATAANLGAIAAQVAPLALSLSVCGAQSAETCVAQLTDATLINSLAEDDLVKLLDGSLNLALTTPNWPSVIGFLASTEGRPLVLQLAGALIEEQPDLADGLDALLSGLELCTRVNSTTFGVAATNCSAVIFDGSALADVNNVAAADAIPADQQNVVPDNWNAGNYALSFLSASGVAPDPYAVSTFQTIIAGLAGSEAGSSEEAVYAAFIPCLGAAQALTKASCFALGLSNPSGAYDPLVVAALSSFIDGDNATARTASCEDDVIDAVVFEESQTMVLAAIAVTAIAGLVGIGAAVSNKLPVGVVSGLLAVGGGVILLIALLHVRNDAPVYALVAASTADLPSEENGYTYQTYYVPGTAQTLALPAALLPMVGGLMLVGASFCNRVSEEDQLSSKVDNTY